MVEVGAADDLAHPALEEEQLLIGGRGAGDGADGACAAPLDQFLEALGHQRDRLALGDRRRVGAASGSGLEDASIVVDEMEAVAPAVTEPPVIDRGVVARHVTDHALVAGLDLGVAAYRAAMADGRRAPHVPGAGAETAVRAGQPAPRAPVPG